MRAILTYHSVDESGSPISVSRARFAGDVRHLATGNVPVVSVAALLRLPPNQSGIAITFDDAFVNFAAEAWPLLRAANLPVTLFVPTGSVGQTNRWSTTPGGSMPELPILDWEALGRLAGEGVTIGAHTRSHPDLRTLGGAALSDEIAGSFADIARETGCRADGFAYPYGYHDDRVVAETRSSCAWACTTKLASLGGSVDVYRLPRLDAYFLRGPAALDAYGSRVFRSYLATRATIRRLRGR